MKMMFFPLNIAYRADCESFPPLTSTIDVLLSKALSSQLL